MNELSKVYSPEEVEEKWYKFWEDNGFFKAAEQDNPNSFSIVIPPPNITGSLHMGHALNTTLQDIIVRWKRMSGYNTLWVPGTDHAGIATQNVVERHIASEGNSRKEYGRERFVKKVWEWREYYGRTIIYQLKRLGGSCDWSRERFTMDDGMSRAVREVFVRLYEDGLIYQGNYIINWCPRCMTALSDLEVEYENIQGKLYHLVYQLADGSGSLTVATTRPETILGDTAVAVNPADTRYSSFIGKDVIIPVVGRVIPVIADTVVEMEFGTGALKITPAHDPNDFEVGNRHGLPKIKVMTDDGKMNDDAGQYKGMDRFECRKAILKDLTDRGELVKEDNHLHAVGHCYRCKTIIEPNVSKQWFVKTKPLAEPAIRAVEEGKVTIIPKGWENTYFEWMNNIKDWCISRQIWWGHQIPAWHCKACGGVTVDRDNPSACKQCGSPDILQDEDVLDTWFSSALWPFSTLGWPEKTEDLKRFYPTSVLVTGFDILFFWVARMMMMGIKFMGDVPFKEVCIHALVRDAEGQKMSKSKGNVIDPLIIMGKYGTDALRFTLASMSSPGRDIKLSEERIEGNRNFANKIWNASRFIMMNSEGAVRLDKDYLTLPDKWILSRLNNTIAEISGMLGEYRFDLASGTIYKFFWHEFCDWYLEFAKLQIAEGGQRKENTSAVLLNTLDNVLRLLHPFMPFITEEIYQNGDFNNKGPSLMVSGYPVVEEPLLNDSAEKDMESVMEVIKTVRSMRSELNIPPSQIVDVHLKIADKSLMSGAITKGHENQRDKNVPPILNLGTDRRGFPTPPEGFSNEFLNNLLEDNFIYLKRLAWIKDVVIGKDIKRPEKSAISVFSGGEIYLPLEGVIDIDKEKRQLSKRLSDMNNEIERINSKLSNKSFIEKAPEEIVQKEKGKYQELTEQKLRIEANLSWLGS
ncbi:MAG: valine--tRNA ligase [Nitrospirae bacterium]|nr:valine--tRNA ligase [Nitrospirota bacterium]